MSDTFNFNGTFNQFGNKNSIVKTGDSFSNKEGPSNLKDPDGWRLYLMEESSKGNLKKVLTEIMTTGSEEDTKQQVTQLLGRIYKLEADLIAGIISKQDEIFETNQIRHSVLLLIKQL